MARFYWPSNYNPTDSNVSQKILRADQTHCNHGNGGRMEIQLTRRTESFEKEMEVVKPTSAETETIPVGSHGNFTDHQRATNQSRCSKAIQSARRLLRGEKTQKVQSKEKWCAIHCAVHHQENHQLKKSTIGGSGSSAAAELIRMGISSLIRSHLA